MATTQTKSTQTAPSVPATPGPMVERLTQVFDQAHTALEHEGTLQELEIAEIHRVAALVGAHITTLSRVGVPLDSPDGTPRVGIRALECWYLDPRKGSVICDQLFGEFNSREEWAQTVIDAQGALWQLSSRTKALPQFGRAKPWNPGHRGHLPASEVLELLLARLAELEVAVEKYAASQRARVAQIESARTAVATPASARKT